MIRLLEQDLKWVDNRKMAILGKGEDPGYDEYDSDDDPAFDEYRPDGFDQEDPDRGAEFKCKSYYSPRYRDLQDYLYTDDYAQVTDFVWEKCQKGCYVVVEDLLYGGESRYSPDKFDQTTIDITDLEQGLNQDTVKQGNKWVNKGKQGTHGKFKTKKQADAQRRAMFSKGYSVK